jgi:hypothetical protein
LEGQLLEEVAIAEGEGEIADVYHGNNILEKTGPSS